MIKIKTANQVNADVLALLGTITYTESHGHFIASKTDLIAYTRSAFSVSKVKEELNDSNCIFYIIYVNELPVGYAKLILNITHKNIISKNNCQLERIYILKDFIPLKIGQELLSFLEKKAKNMKLDTMSLSVYKENNRAIRFYEKNDFKEVGISNFIVNGKGYENIVFVKTL